MNSIEVSQNCSADGIPFPERFTCGWCPTSGKKADLMFVQHMVAVLHPGGLVCPVMPHGVLFRGGAEKQIREGFIRDDLLEAVIGLMLAYLTFHVVRCLFNANIDLVENVAMFLVPVALILHENGELLPGEEASPAIASAASLNKGGTVAESSRGGSITATHRAMAGQ